MVYPTCNVASMVDSHSPSPGTTQTTLTPEPTNGHTPFAEADACVGLLIGNRSWGVVVWIVVHQPSCQIRFRK